MDGVRGVHMLKKQNCFMTRMTNLFRFPVYLCPLSLHSLACRFLAIPFSDATVVIALRHLPRRRLASNRKSLLCAINLMQQTIWLSKTKLTMGKSRRRSAKDGVI